MERRCVSKSSCRLHEKGGWLQAPCLRLQKHVIGTNMPPSLPIALQAWAKESIETRLCKAANSGGDCLPPEALQAALQLHETAVVQARPGDARAAAGGGKKQRVAGRLLVAAVAKTIP